jgi:protein-L-isoaspartate(D-aspartate) O-methyltransferase
VTLSREKLDRGDAVSRALSVVPRERFVRVEDIAASSRDQPFNLSDDGGSTVSAMHAYAMAYRALDLGPGDAMVDLGGGTGYGAALAAEIVGPSGSVLTVEVVDALAERARDLLSDRGRVRVVVGDAHETSHWEGACKVYCGFALSAVPRSWVDALAEGGALVAPVQTGTGQTLTRFEKVNGELRQKPIARVAYVPDRSIEVSHGTR